MGFADFLSMVNRLGIICGAEGGDRKKTKDTYAPVKTIRGIIVPADWDDKGNVIATAVSTYQEEFYIVDRSGKGDELKAFLRKEVEVRGRVKEQDEKRIKVEDFKPLTRSA